MTRIRRVLHKLRYARIQQLNPGETRRLSEAVNNCGPAFTKIGGKYVRKVKKSVSRVNGQ